MVFYECKNCKFISKLKGDYKRHLRTKKHMLNTNEKISEEIKNKKSPKKEYFCKNCENSYTRRDNYKRHVEFWCKNKKTNICKEICNYNENNENNEINDIDIGDLNNTVVSIKNEMEELKKKNVELEKELKKSRINVFINMQPIKLLNDNYYGNPSLKEIEYHIENTEYSKDDLNPIKNGYEVRNLNVIANTINDIIIKANKFLINKGNILNTCDYALFINDGSCRQYIAKNENEWDYYKDDKVLDNMITTLFNKTYKSFSIYPFLRKTERKKILKIIKNSNDYNSEKSALIDSLV